MFITLGKLNKKMIFFIILLFFNLFDAILNNNNISNKSYFINASIFFLSLFFNGILWLIISRSLKFLNKNDKVKELFFDNDTNLSELQKTNLKEQKEKNKKKWSQIKLLIFVVSYCIISKCFYIYIRRSRKYINRIGGMVVLCYFLEIASLIIFSFLFIKITRLYKHHYVSLIIIIISLIIINITSCIKSEYKDYKSKNSIEFVIMLLISNITTALEYVLGCLYLNKTEGNISKLCFWIGIFGFIFLIIIQVIFGISSLKYQDIFDNLDEEDKNKIPIYFHEFLLNFKLSNLYVFLNMIISCFIYYSQWYIIYNFSPNHLGAIESISNLLFVFFSHKSDFNIFYILGSIIIIFMVFVFNEFIILRFCGLEKNTKIEIEKRALEDENIGNIDPFLNEDFNKEKDNEKLELLENNNINSENQDL